jgi:hypothetical protein
MFLTAIALLALHQSPVSHVAPAPNFPMGTRAELRQIVRSIQVCLSHSDVAGAQKLADGLPKSDVIVGWDESAVPETMRASVEEMRDEALQSWARITNVHFKIAATGDVNIRFARLLGADAAGLPEESDLVFGDNPRVVATIGLTRGNPGQSILPKEVSSEIAHAIGAYFGNADDALPGNCMYRDNRPDIRTFGPSQGNLVVASRILSACDAIRALVKANQPIQIADGEAELSPTKVDLGPVRQGLKVPLDFVVKNDGTGPLNYNLVPDCSCFTRIPPGQIAPGASVTLRTLVNTAVYIGDVSKILVLYSNDPAKPVQEIPIHFSATPPCRLYRPAGDTVVLPVKNNEIDILLTIPEGSDLKPGRYDWNGFDAKVSMEPWSGSAADPLLNEPSKPRTGYVFRIVPGKNQIPGRSTGTLHVVTDDDAIPDFSYSLNIQNGIIALPDDFFMGEMSTVSRGSFLVSRPGRPFKITSVDAGAKCLKATVTRIPGRQEYRVDVIYDGTGQKGDFIAQIKVRTDDPAQRVILVTMHGTVL